MAPRNTKNNSHDHNVTQKKMDVGCWMSKAAGVKSIKSKTQRGILTSGLTGEQNKKRLLIYTKYLCYVHQSIHTGFSPLFALLVFFFAVLVSVVTPAPVFFCFFLWLASRFL